MTGYRNNKSHRGGRAHVKVPQSFKPFVDRRVVNTTVKCPSCGAEVGVHCTIITGTATQHQPRRRMAIRLLNQQLEAQDVVPSL